MTRRVVITGIGVIAANGADTETFWRSCLQGTAAAAPIPEHWRDYFTPVSTLWAPLPELSVDAQFVNRIERMQLDRFAILGLGACRQALANAGLTLTQRDEKKNTYLLCGPDPRRCGVFVGTGMGGICSYTGAEGNHLFVAARSRVSLPDDRLNSVLRMPSRFNPLVVSMVMPNSCSASIGVKLSITGPNRTCAQACAAGACAIGDAFREIRSGAIDCAIAGGAECLGDEYGGIFRGFDVARALVRDCSDPATANRPFDKRRSGFLFAEGGAAMLFIEALDHALSRGARPIAEIRAFAESYDAHSMMALEPGGKEIERMLFRALSEGGLSPGDVDYVNAHGTGTELNDEVEAQVIRRVFGERPLVNSTKSLIGHSVGASGAIEAAVTALSIRDQTTHVCKNLEEPIAELNFVREPRYSPIRCAVSQSFAFGGHNAVVVMGQVET